MYKVKSDSIIIDNEKDFNPKHILECGQIFRYENLNENYIVFSGDKFAKIIKSTNGYIIKTNHPQYFAEYFDLNTDYAKIKNELKNYNNQFLNSAIDFGEGIRILKQDPFEMIISFIISANNNIPRIKNSIKKLCEAYGKKIDEDKYAFPTLKELQNASEEFFKSIGLGYRAPYMVETIKILNNIDLQQLSTLDTISLRKELMKLKGVGRKVADCIMLFGFQKQDVFPIDTWTHKVYTDYFYAGEKSNEQIANYFVKYFKNLSGYAQQYFYYWKQKTKN